MGTMNFIKISSDFEILAKQRRQHKNGIHLRSLMIFYLMCKHDGETIGGIYKKFYPTYQHDINTASMSRVSNSLVRLGLIKLYENMLDRRFKNFTFTPLGKRFKKEMENIYSE
jgi:hypothetical protein